jgi:hypothetical protein
MFGNYFRVFGSDGRAILRGKVKAITEVLTTQSPITFSKVGLVKHNTQGTTSLLSPISLLKDTSKE